MYKYCIHCRAWLGSAKDLQINETIDKDVQLVHQISHIGFK